MTNRTRMIFRALWTLLAILLALSVARAVYDATQEGNIVPDSTDTRLASHTSQQTSSPSTGPWEVSNTSSRSLPYHLLNASSGLEAEVIGRRVYNYAPELRTDIIGYAAFDVRFTNHSTTEARVDRSVNSCLTDGVQHTYERDLDEATRPVPVYDTVAPGESRVITLGCETHDPEAELDYVLRATL